MEYHRSGEYTELPDEFNRHIRQHQENSTGNKKITLHFLTAFVAMVLLVFPITINAHSHPHPIDPPGPVPVDPLPPVIDPIDEEYEIIGLWERNDYVYRFLEDGTGYLYNGTFFDPLKWSKEGKDYHVEVYGVVEAEGTSTFYWRNSFNTIMAKDGLYLAVPGNENGQVAFNHRTAPVNDEKVLPLLNKPLSESIIGFWETERFAFNQNDDIYCFLSYIDIQASKASFDFATTHTNYGIGHFEKPWHYDEKYPEFIIHVTDGTEMKVSVEVSSNNTHNYIGESIIVYYTLTEDGEMVIADGHSNRNYMYRMVWQNDNR